MPLFLIILMVVAYVLAVALLLTYVAVFVAPRMNSRTSKRHGHHAPRLDEYLLETDLRGTAPIREPMDPVCGRKAPLDGLYSHAWKGRVYYFCSEECRHRFARQPQAYLGKAGAARVRPQRSFAHFR